jgi:IclR family transcriptional regulator, pca regulon regulatory protein
LVSDVTQSAPADDAAPAARERGRDFVKSLERGLTVIRAFGRDRPAMTLAEVAEATGLTRAAARRFLLTLIDISYMDTDGRYFWLRPRVLELGYSYLSGLSWPDAALPHVEHLVAQVEDASELGILDGADVVFILRVPGPHIMDVSVSIGARLPAHATALGKVLLAGLDEEELDEYFARAELVKLAPQTISDPSALRAEIEETRTRGWATCDEELEEGLRAVAVPLHDRNGEVVAALNLSSHVGRRDMKSVRKELLPALKAAAEQVEADMRVAAQGNHRTRAPRPGAAPVPSAQAPRGSRAAPDRRRRSASAQ